MDDGGTYNVWNRKRMKEIGKRNFKSNYWIYVGVMALLVFAAVLITNVSSTFNFGVNVSELEAFANGEFDPSINPEVASVNIFAPVLKLFGIASLFTVILSLFLLCPYAVGLNRFSLVISNKGPAKFENSFFGFKNNYLNIVLASFLTLLYEILWSLLFIIPGIIKSFSYFCTPYILAENPDIKPNEAITLSRQMMDGHKWDMFVLGLSFLGWIILGSLTMGILDIFYVLPYMQATVAEAYKTIKEDAIQKGILPEGLLPDAEQTALSLEKL